MVRLSWPWHLEGQTLADKIAEGPLKLDTALDIASQIAKGLQEAHTKGTYQQTDVPLLLRSQRR